MSWTFRVSSLLRVIVPPPTKVLPMLPFLLLAVPALAQTPAKTAFVPTEPATYVGDEPCTACHRRLTEQYGFSVHARIKPHEVKTDAMGCESCHGPASNHVASRGKGFVGSFREDAAQDSAKNCVRCHFSDKAQDWPGSIHQMGGLACSDCHNIHQSRPVPLPTSNQIVGSGMRRPELAMIEGKRGAPPKMASLHKREPELCLDCHKEKRAQINYSSHHPIIEGRMTCSSCHNPHGGEGSLLRTSERGNDLCYGCHQNLQGPFVFEHAAVEEGCTSCHNPHGSVVNNMLTQNEPFLCLQCHEAHFHIGRDGVSTPVIQPSGGSQNPFGSAGFRRGFSTKCTNCHSMVHGSDLPSQSVPSRGGALTR